MIAAEDDADLAAVSAQLEGATAQEIIAWAVAEFGDSLCLTTSLTDALLIDLATSVDPSIEVVFIDTQYHFRETFEMAVTVRERYGANLRVMTPDFEPDDLWRLDVDTCCKRRKVDQLDRALAGKRAWLSGLRRDDDPSRAATPIVQRDRRGLVKVNPVATWTDQQVADHLRAYDVPVNPLQARGYPSIGCWPCTQPVEDGQPARAGRWAGTAKTECGLHG